MEPIDHVRAGELESELAAAAELTVLDDANLLPIDTPSEGGLVPGPVGRRVRRDRPPLPQDAPGEQPEVAEVDAAPISTDRGDRSPLPEAPLPPAALPARPAAPATPVPSAAEVAHPVVDVEPAPAAPEPAVPAPVASATIEATPAPEPEVVAEPAAAVEPELVTEPAADVEPDPVVEPVREPVVLVAGADGLLAVPGTIVRQGGGAVVEAVLDDAGAHASLSAGWIWASPGDGEPVAVHVALPAALASVAPGATVLAVVEPEGTSFVFVADGTVELRRPDGIATLGRGSIAMLEPDGGAQVDQASDAELASDPIVAENLALDAEL
ncbi:MAG: hypothetical protein R2702_18455 [Acidimicrobiales bacterium]